MSTRKLEYARGEQIAEKYEIVDLLDESPLGLTYRVKHLRSGKYVRLTLLRPRIAGSEQRDQILAAFNAAKELGTTNVAKVGELGEAGGVAYYTTEDFEGQSLRQMLQEYKVSGKQFDVKEAAQITMQILEALQAAHNSGLVMRALRPEHVLVQVRRTGPRQQNFVATVKVLHLGFWDLVPVAVLGEDEFTRGEAQYLGPELKSFEPTPSPRSDVYSAGVMLYEMLTGTAPVGTFQLPKTKRPDLPEHVNNIVELALAHSPDDRYPSAQDFINDIQRIFQGTGAAETNNRGGQVVIMIALLLAMVFVFALGIILFTFRPDAGLQAKARDSQLRAEIYENHRIPTPEETSAILKNHPANMMYVPGGPTVIGRLHQEGDLARGSEALAQTVETKPFLIDAFEYPNLRNATPRYEVSFSEAEKLCADQGKRLCSAEEWEKACRGQKNTIYSYADRFDESYCGRGLESLYRSGERPECRSGWGVFDLSGNFREWTSSSPPGKDNRRIVKGGLRSAPQKGTRCGFDVDENPGFKDRTLSFRCCRNVDAPPVEASPAPDGAPQNP